MRWEVPKLWETSAYILGGGPSLSDVDLSRIEGKNVVAVNNAYRKAPWASFLYFQDCAWWDWHEEEVMATYPGMIVSACNRVKSHERVRWLQRGFRNRYDPRPGMISKGSNSGHGAICLAAALGAKTIYLLGFDMHAKNGHNFHQDHKRTVPHTIYETNFFRSFDALVEGLDEIGVEVVNATPGSALPTFPIVDWRDVC